MSLIFLPWLRMGMSALQTTNAASGRRMVVASANLSSKTGTHVTQKSFPLKGPGEVVGFSDRVIARTEPAANDPAFPPNQFPYVEFLDADFPWRYSLEEPGGDNRLTPWMVLIVLKQGEFQELPAGQYCPAIEVQTKFLPNLSEAWAYAHVQIAKTPECQLLQLKEFIQAHPEYVSSRLLCPKRLKSSTKYSAFLVPAYQMGREAGLGQPVSEAMEPAWNSGDGGVVLPYYYRWEFSTAQEGDFEELARRIHGFEGCIRGTRPVRDEQGTPMEFEGVVIPYGQTPADKSYTQHFAERHIAQFNRMYGKSRITTTGKDKPELCLPLYGINHADAKYLVKPNETGKDKGTWKNRPGTDIWFSEVNLDPNFRYAAALGAAIVRQHQDYFVSLCFTMAGDIKDANQLSNRRKTISSLRKNILDRHINRLDDVRFMLVIKNLQAFYHIESSRTQEHGSTRAPTAQVRFTTERSVAQNLPVNALKYIAAHAGKTSASNAAFLNFKDGEQTAFTSDAQHFKDFLAATDKIQDVLDKMVAGSRYELVNGFSPRIEEGLFKYLPQALLSGLIPGLGELSANSALLFSLNRRFLEALLVGANQEMINELIWREFPVNRRATIFTRFWDASEICLPADIREIRDWQGRLGEHPKTSEGNGENLILAIRADLLQRFPNTTMYLLEYDPQHQPDWQTLLASIREYGTSVTGCQLHQPVFTVTLYRDLIFMYYTCTREYVQKARQPFKLTKLSLENLKNSGISDSLLEELRPLENQEFTTEEEFLNAVKKRIGTEQTDTYKELILKYASRKAFVFIFLENITIPQFGLDESMQPIKSGFNDLSWEDFERYEESGYLKINAMANKLNKELQFEEGVVVNRELQDAAKLALITLNRPVGVILDFKQVCPNIS